MEMTEQELWEQIAKEIEDLRGGAERRNATDVSPDGAWNPVLTATDIKFAAIMFREGFVK
jgi:hypothetical protein